MATLTPTELRRLSDAKKWSVQQLGAFREKRNKGIQEFVGSVYTEYGINQKDNPVPFLVLLENTLGRHLTASRYKVLVTSQYPALKMASIIYSLDLEHLLEEIKFARTMRKLVADALFGLGIARVGLNHSGTVEVGGFLHDIGQPYVDRVDLDDWVHDMSAAEWESIQFCGHKQRWRKDEALASGLFDNAVLEKIHGDIPYDPDDPFGLSQEISGELAGPDQQFKESITLWNLWLPSENMLVTVPACDDTKVLRETEWDGPETGPYHMLYFTEVPGNNVMPLSPIQTMIPLHQAINFAFRKTWRQAIHSKNIMGFRSGSERDASRILNAKENEMIGLNNPDDVKPMQISMLDGTIPAFMLQSMQLANRYSGNLDLLAGISPQSDTLGQDQMLSQAANQQIADMQERTNEFTRQIVRDLGQWWWEDPLRQTPLTYRTQGIEIPVMSTPESREGDVWQFNVGIDVYGAQYRSATQRANQIMFLFQNVILPTLPLLQAQGIMPNLEGLLRTIARYWDMPELHDILVFMRQQQNPLDQPQVPQQGPKSPVTHRTVTRVNRPGAIAQQQDAELQQAYMGRMSQPSERASLVRSAG